MNIDHVQSGENDPRLDATQVAALLSISTSSAYRLMRSNKIRSARLGPRMFRARLSAVLDYERSVTGGGEQ